MHRRKISSSARPSRVVSYSPAIRPTIKNIRSNNHHRTPSSNANKQSSSSSSVGVYLRLRPLKIEEPTLSRLDAQQVKTLPPDGSDSQTYSFTRVFDDAPQSEIFDQVARPVTEDFILNAKDGLIFTYGITGSGKTYTMEGLKTDPGLIYRSIDFLFNSIAAHQTQRSQIVGDDQNRYKLDDLLYPNLDRAETPLVMTPSETKFCQTRAKETASVGVDPSAYFCLFISLVELYGKQVFDLFDKDAKNRERKIRTDQRGMSYVANVTEYEVKSADEAVVHYTRGIQRRKTGSTALNQNSSRGHCVLNLKLVQVRKSPYNDRFDEDTLIASQLCLVDLAGSERAKRSGATGGALHEACNINNSLGALRKCIRELRDREPTNSTQYIYRDYSLTRLFKSYFEGHGSVRMVLCVKPTEADFHENNIAMEFGLLTQDVAVDYASPPKMIKRSKSRVHDADLNCDMMYEYISRKKSLYEPNQELNDNEFISNWIDKLKNNRDRRKRYIETAFSAQNEVRENILRTMDVNTSLKQQYEDRVKELRLHEKKVGLLKSDLNTTERSREKLNDKVKSLERENRELKSREKHTRIAAQELEESVAHQDKIYKDILNLIKNEHNRNETIKRLDQLLKRSQNEWTTIAPSAPVEHMQSSSPIDNPNNQSTSEETTESHTPPPTTTNSSSPVTEYHDNQRISRSPIKTMASPNRCSGGGVPVVNPRHNRSLSCSSLQWIHHKPPGTINTGTVMKPNFKNGRSVRKLRSSDILRKDAGGYSVVHQDADPNGEVETSIYKGQILPTVCGGKQVILNDIETMRQVSPKRQRAISDAHFTH